MRKLIAATATATSAMSIGTGDRTENEQDYSREALFLLNKKINTLCPWKNRERAGRDRVEG